MHKKFQVKYFAEKEENKFFLFLFTMYKILDAGLLQMRIFFYEIINNQIYVIKYKNFQI